MSRHHEKLSQSSILGKLCAAASVLPVFVIAAIFKLGVPPLIKLRSDTHYQIIFLLGMGLPTLVLFIVRNIVKDLAVTNVAQGVLSEYHVLRLWPKNNHGKRIGLAMAVFIYLLFATPLLCLIANPEPETQWSQMRVTYDVWAAKLRERLRIAAMSFLVIRDQSNEDQVSYYNENCVELNQTNFNQETPALALVDENHVEKYDNEAPALSEVVEETGRSNNDNVKAQ